MQQYLTSDNFWSALLFAIAVAWLIKQFFDAWLAIDTRRKNSKIPFDEIDSRIGSLEQTIATLESRLDAERREIDRHQHELEDLRTGQAALCRGVQALLDHELHDGNSDEMQAASDGIGKWLRTR